MYLSMHLGSYEETLSCEKDTSGAYCLGVLTHYDFLLLSKAFVYATCCFLVGEGKEVAQVAQIHGALGAGFGLLYAAG